MRLFARRANSCGGEIGAKGKTPAPDLTRDGAGGYNECRKKVLPIDGQSLGKVLEVIVDF